METSTKTKHKNQSEFKYTITEMKNTLERINSRLDDKKHITDLDKRIVDITQSELKKKKISNEDNLRDFKDNIKHPDICILEVPGEDREKEAENVFEEIIAENVTNLEKKTDESRYPNQDILKLK